MDHTCTITIPKDAFTTRYQTVTAGITNDQGEGISRSYFAVIGAGDIVLSGHVTNDDKPVKRAPIEITGGKEGLIKRQTDLTGAYNAILPKGNYVVEAGYDQIVPIESAGCKKVGHTCHVNLDRDRQADFEVGGPNLVFKAELGAMVHSTKYHQLARAGAPIVIHVTIQNRGHDRVLIDPYYATLSGNAADGHIQPAGEIGRAHV